jgi:hypothetical protein
VGSTKCFGNCGYLELSNKNECREGLTHSVVIGAGMGCPCGTKIVEGGGGGGGKKGTG